MALNKEKQQSKDRHAILEFERLLDFVEEQTQIPAIVVQVGGQWRKSDEDILELAGSEYVLDLYENGIARDSLGNIISKSTRQGLLGRCLIYADRRAVDSEVLVTLVGDRAYIRPQLLPSDSGFGKVLMLADDLTPGSWRADYVRFTGAAPES